MRIDSQVLFEFRKVYRLTLTEMASLLGISESYLCRIEKQERRVTDRIRKSLIEEFELTPDKLERVTRVYMEFSK